MYLWLEDPGKQVVRHDKVSEAGELCDTRPGQLPLVVSQELHAESQLSAGGGHPQGGHHVVGELAIEEDGEESNHLLSQESNIVEPSGFVLFGIFNIGVIDYRQIVQSTVDTFTKT